MPTRDHYPVLIIGGGSAGITVAARLRKHVPAGDIGVVEPAEKHYYQPLWTLVGGGVMPKRTTERSEASVMPAGVSWVRDSVTEFLPAENAVRTAGGATLRYDYLVVAAGIQIDWHKVKNLPECLGKDGVCSNYSYEHVQSTWEFIRGFKGGTAVFTQPNTPIKCGGAPQKIMYLAEDHFRRSGVRDRCDVRFYSGDPAIFKVKKYADALTRVIESRGMKTFFQHNLVELRPQSREAVFQNLAAGGAEVVQRYDMIHVTPPMSAPDVIKRSPLANAGGWVDVDKATLRHTRFANVFSCGDASSLPTSKTGAAIRKQAPVLVANLLAAMRQAQPAQTYDGYTSCPLVTGYGKLILAEFDYDLKPTETFPFDQGKERRSMYLLKKHVLPPLYWSGMLKGRA